MNKESAMFPFGVTYYPDQWPKENWEAELLKIKEAGFNLIRFGEMAWNWVEREEGKFTFDDLDHAMDLATKYGLKVVLGIGTSQAPPWLICKYPEVRPLAHDGTLYPQYGPRPNICRDNPVLKKLAERYINKIVRRYAKHPALLMWQIDNEPVYPPLDVAELKDYCHCPSTRESFIKWAKAKYKTIEEANRVWGMKFWTAEFSDFSQVSPPMGGMWDAVSPHIFLDWMRFKSESLNGWVRWMKQKVREIDPDHKIGTNGFIGISPRVPDHDVLSEGLDWYGWDVYPAGGRMSGKLLAMTADLWRSYTEGKNTEFHVTELQGGQNVRWGSPDHVLGPEIRTWTHQVLSHGAKVLLYHAWRPPLFGSETGGFGILSTNGSRTARLEAIEKAAKEVLEIAPVMSDHKLIPQVAIAYLRGSDVEVYQEQGPSRVVVGQWEAAKTDLGVMYSFNSLAGAHSITWGLFNPVAFIFERHLEEGNLPYQAVFLPNPYVLKEKHVKVLRKYVYDGGILITDARFGLKNEHAHLYERPLMESMLEVSYDHTEVIPEGERIEELDLAITGFKDIVSVKDGVVARFTDGSPAIIEKRIGKGKVIFAAFSLFLSLEKDPSKKAIDFLRAYLPVPSMKISGDDEVEAVYWEDTTPLIYLINRSGRPAKVSISVANKFSKAEDILKKEKLGFEQGSINLNLEERGVKLLHFSS